MPLKIGINGFGRIGRMVLRASMQRDDIEVVAVNDPFIAPDYMVYQFNYDSAQGTYAGKVETDGKSLIVDGKPITVFQERDPKQIAWAKVGAVYVAECTGIFTEDFRSNAAKNGKGAEQHLQGGARKVIISAPSKTAPMFCMNVNTDELSAAQDIISNASCTTNCLAPVVKVLNDTFGIEYGLMSTVHAVTATQKTVDSPSKKWRSGRAGYSNIIPASTGAAQAIGKVIKSMNGKLNGMAFRVPVQNGSVVDLVVMIKRDAVFDDVKNAMKKASEGELRGILGYTEECIVSSDIIGIPQSSIFDAQASMMMGKRMVKVITWYDNEWGYSCRLLDLCALVARKEAAQSLFTVSMYRPSFMSGVYGFYTIPWKVASSANQREKETMRTCQRCQKPFDLRTNTEKSCRLHRSSYVQRYDDGEFFWSWDCCGALKKNAPCCGAAEHITYNVKWSKDMDFYAKKSQTVEISAGSGTWIYHPTRGYIMVKWDEVDDLRAIPILNKGQEDVSGGGAAYDYDMMQKAKEVVNVDLVYDVCERYNNKRLSLAVKELSTQLPFTEVTNRLVAKMMILDLMKTNKLYNVHFIYDLDEDEQVDANKDTDDLISTFSTTTLDKLAGIL